MGNAADQGQSDFDPIEWAIVGIVIAGTSLVLTIEQKIKDRRTATSLKEQEKAVRNNRVRLGNLRSHLGRMRDLLKRAHEIGKIVVRENEPGVSRSSLVFTDAHSAEEFNRIFEGILQHIGRLNRLIDEIDLEGLPVDEGVMKEFVQIPFEQAKKVTAVAIDPEIDPYLRLKETDHLLQSYIDLIANLENILDSKGG